MKINIGYKLLVIRSPDFWLPIVNRLNTPPAHTVKKQFDTAKHTFSRRHKLTVFYIIHVSENFPSFLRTGLRRMSHLSRGSPW